MCVSLVKRMAFLFNACFSCLFSLVKCFLSGRGACNVFLAVRLHRAPRDLPWLGLHTRPLPGEPGRRGLDVILFAYSPSAQLQGKAPAVAIYVYINMVTARGCPAYHIYMYTTMLLLNVRGD